MHYTGTIWRPPYEASSLLLEVTAGCTHHKCKFCTLYDELPFPFQMSSLEDVEADLKEAACAIRAWKGVPFRRVFLTGANPFVLKFDRLMKIADMIREYIPGCKTIGSFARVTDVSLKTDEQLDALQKAGFDGLTIGIETGDEEALRFMNKGYQTDEIVDQCRRLDRAGIHYNFFYLAGISGEGRGESGAKITAEVCNQLHPSAMGVNMLTIYPNSELYREIQRGTWKEESELEKYREIRTLIEHLTVPTTFGALGASNAFQIMGKLPEDKKELLNTLDRIIKNVSEKELRQYRTNVTHL